MKSETITRLNAINREFYRITATEFDATRQYAWAGWERLLNHLPEKRPLSVLDVGCGNGRFGVFLRDHLDGEIHYHGMDNSPTLLDFARETLANSIQITLTEQDIITAPPDSGSYDVVVLFGVIHHVPGSENRRQLVQTLAKRVSAGGILAFAAWRFMDNARLSQKVVDWRDDLERESGDYLLDWKRGEVAVRYCHFVDDAEHAALVSSTGLAEIDTFRADGKDNQTNRYSVLHREA